MTYENFKKIVPNDVQEKIKQLVDSVEFHELISGHQESISEQTISPIEGNYCSGWIPNQDGGFSSDQLYVSDINAPSFTQKQHDFISKQYDDMLNSFMADYNLETIDYEDEELQERLYEYEREWWEPALLEFQVFIEREDKFEDNSPMSVICRLSINYKDAPYYREKYVEDIQVRSYSLNEFMQTENRVIIEGFRI